MILVDTSVWIDHWRKNVPQLVAMLNGSQVLIHPLIVGELAVGQLKNRSVTMKLLQALPQIDSPGFHECLAFLEWHKLYGAGLSWNDVQLLTAAKLARATLWSFDKPLINVARKLNLVEEF